MTLRLSELPELTGLRGFAALWVVLFHVWGMSGQVLLPGGASALFATGWAGVDLFFTLSAFLLTLPFAAWRLGIAPRPALGPYFLRRVLRIFPAYYLQLAILLILAAAFGVGRGLDLHDFIAHLRLWLLLGDPPVMPLNGVWFTLPIEFAFYLVLPLLAFGLGRRRWVLLLLGAWLLTLAYRYTTYATLADAPLAVRVNAIERFPGRLDQFVLGMLAAYAYVAMRAGHWTAWRPSADALALAGAAGFAVLCGWIYAVRDTYWDGHYLLFAWHTAASVCLGLLLIGAAFGTRATRIAFANRPLHYLGEVSFGVYLWHFPILEWLRPHLPPDLSPAAALAVLGLPVIVLTLLAAHLSYVLVERPCLRLGRRRSDRPGLVTELPPA